MPGAKAAQRSPAGMHGVVSGICGVALSHSNDRSSIIWEHVAREPYISTLVRQTYRHSTSKMWVHRPWFGHSSLRHMPKEWRAISTWTNRIQVNFDASYVALLLHLDMQTEATFLSLIWAEYNLDVLTRVYRPYMQHPIRSKRWLTYCDCEKLYAKAQTCVSWLMPRTRQLRLVVATSLIFTDRNCNLFNETEMCRKRWQKVFFGRRAANFIVTLVEYYIFG